MPEKAHINTVTPKTMAPRSRVMVSGSWVACSAWL